MKRTNEAPTGADQSNTKKARVYVNHYQSKATKVIDSQSSFGGAGVTFRGIVKILSNDQRSFKKGTGYSVRVHIMEPLDKNTISSRDNAKYSMRLNDSGNFVDIFTTVQVPTPLENPDGNKKYSYKSQKDESGHDVVKTSHFMPGFTYKATYDDGNKDRFTVGKCYYAEITMSGESSLAAPKKAPDAPLAYSEVVLTENPITTFFEPVQSAPKEEQVKEDIVYFNVRISNILLATKDIPFKETNEMIGDMWSKMEKATIASALSGIDFVPDVFEELKWTRSGMILKTGESRLFRAIADSDDVPEWIKSDEGFRVVIPSQNPVSVVVKDTPTLTETQNFKFKAFNYNLETVLVTPNKNDPKDFLERRYSFVFQTYSGNNKVPFESLGVDTEDDRTLYTFLKTLGQIETIIVADGSLKPILDNQPEYSGVYQVSPTAFYLNTASMMDWSLEIPDEFILPVLAYKSAHYKWTPETPLQMWIDFPTLNDLMSKLVTNVMLCNNSCLINSLNMDLIKKLKESMGGKAKFHITLPTWLLKKAIEDLGDQYDPADTPFVSAVKSCELYDMYQKLLKGELVDEEAPQPSASAGKGGQKKPPVKTPPYVKFIEKFMEALSGYGVEMDELGEILSAAPEPKCLVWISNPINPETYISDAKSFISTEVHRRKMIYNVPVEAPREEPEKETVGSDNEAEEVAEQPPQQQKDEDSD